MAINIRELYSRDIERHPLLTIKEEYELGRKLREKKDQKARGKLITSNLRLVVRIATKFKGSGIPFMDLIQEGNSGLVRAACEDFDERKGRFANRAGDWIKARIKRAIENNSRLVRIPAHAHYIVRKALPYVREDLEAGNEPDWNQIYLAIKNDTQVKHNCRTPKALKRIVSASSKKVTSINATSSNGKNVHNCYISSLSTDSRDTIEQQDTFYHIREAILSNSGVLTDLEKEVIKHRYGFYGEPKTLKETTRNLVEIGYEYTREGVRQVEKRALGKVRAIF